MVMELLKRATGYLEGHGSSSPRLDAELLLAHTLELRRLDLYLQHDRPVGDPQLSDYRELVRRRGEGEPVAYLTGHKEFMALDFKVTPAVLVPNPDTEVLVQRAVAWARDRGGPVEVADIGTGSGCIAVSIAHYVPEARVIATDIDAAALEVAARNAARHHVDNRVHLAHGNLLEPIASAVDLICANLPYLSSELRLEMEVEAQPATALFAGPDGSELVDRVLKEAPAHLRPRGTVLAEMDPVIAPTLVQTAGKVYAGHRVHRDLGGHERVIEAWIE
jgi:release factor glutamine methyltransferase